jgi:hypothetical protein
VQLSVSLFQFNVKVFSWSTLAGRPEKFFSPGPEPAFSSPEFYQGNPSALKRLLPLNLY